MRYEVNQKIWTIFFHMVGSRMYPLYQNYQPEYFKGEGLPEISFVELTVKEHHKVPNEWDESKPPKLEYDGFILVGPNDVPYVNQYPRASYGQLDDRADGRFHVSNEYWRENLNGKLEAFDLKQRQAGERWNGPIVETNDLRRYLDELGTFLFNDWPKQKERGDLREGAEQDVAKLQLMYDTVIEQFEKQTGNKIIVQDLTFGGKVVRVKARHSINVPETEEL